MIKGSKHSEEIKRKISNSLKGNKNPFWGKHHTEESKIKMSKAHTGKKLSEEHRINMSKALKGRKKSEEHKRNISKAQLGEKNHLWKGDKVGYRALHRWVEKWKGKPTQCEHCKEDGLIDKQINWANKSGNYLRDLRDWIRLCVKCHREYDKGSI
ncbi:NUMOD3 domain-containing DNA-binding protein [Patescibacteria group bacterium AH-259-L07]|nr:NUMOD3 domain-containing DNA-binding protein [Patescibacteria group bacterium AH-259-L07]